MENEGTISFMFGGKHVLFSRNSVVYFEALHSFPKALNGCGVANYVSETPQVFN